jgi:hypothetical protein
MMCKSNVCTSRIYYCSFYGTIANEIVIMLLLFLFCYYYYYYYYFNIVVVHEYITTGGVGLPV